LASNTDKLEERKKAAKERAKKAKAAYMARADVQARLKKQKEKLKELHAAQRKKLSEARKERRRTEKAALAESKQLTRQRRQRERDSELEQTITKASAMPDHVTSTNQAPRLKVINGGLSQSSRTRQE